MPRGARVTNRDLQTTLKENRDTLLSIVAALSKVEQQVEQIQKDLCEHREITYTRIDKVEAIAIDVKTTRDKAIWMLTIIMSAGAFLTYIATLSWQKVLAVIHAVFR